MLNLYACYRFSGSDFFTQMFIEEENWEKAVVYYRSLLSVNYPVFDTLDEAYELGDNAIAVVGVDRAIVGDYYKHHGIVEFL